MSIGSLADVWADLHLLKPSVVNFRAPMNSSEEVSLVVCYVLVAKKGLNVDQTIILVGKIPLNVNVCFGRECNCCPMNWFSRFCEKAPLSWHLTLGNAMEYRRRYFAPWLAEGGSIVAATPQPGHHFTVLGSCFLVF